MHDMRANTLRYGRHAIRQVWLTFVHAEVHAAFHVCNNLCFNLPIALSLTIPSIRFCRRKVLYAPRVFFFSFGYKSELNKNEVDKTIILWICGETKKVQMIPPSAF